MSDIQKNVAGQKIRVFAFDSTTNLPVTGDAANITGKISLDWAIPVEIEDTNPTEVEAGYYNFDLTQSETNCDVMDVFPQSSTTNVIVIGVPATHYPVVKQTGDSFALTNNETYGLSALKTLIDAVADELNPDEVIDDQTTPWSVKYYKKGTATLLGTKQLQQLDGTDITSANQTVGGKVQAP